MTTLPDEWLLTPLICFCRVGACLMLMPGYSLARIPMRVRLWLAITLSLALAPFAANDIASAIKPQDSAFTVVIATSELTIGISLGLLARVYFSALHFAGVFIATSIGLSSPASTGLDEGEAAPPPADLLLLGALALFFLGDMHVVVLAALAKSYATIPVRDLFSAGATLEQLVNTLQLSFRLVTRMCGPVIVFIMAVNTALGIANRMVPMLPMQFLGAPLVLGSGLAVIATTSPQMLQAFLQQFSAWLNQ